MKHSFSFFLLMLGSLGLRAQVTFQETIGGTWADNNECMNRSTGAITTVPGSGYAICHTTQCFGPSANPIQPCPYFIRLNANGDTICTKTYSTTSNSYGRSIFSVSDGGFIMGVNLGGSGLSCSGLIRTNNFGDTIWTRGFPSSNGYGTGYFGMPVSDGGFVAAGEVYTTREGGTLAKVTSTGAFVFGKSYFPSTAQEGMFIYGTCETHDHCILATGLYTYFNSSTSVMILKTDSAGNLLWCKTYDGTDTQIGYSIMELPDYSIMVTGDRYSGGFGDFDAMVLKTDAAGNPLFEKIYGDATYQWTNSLILRNDGTIALCGLTETTPGQSNALLLNIDQNGNIVWTKRYGGYSLDLGNSITKADDGGIAFTGFANSFGAGNSDIYIVKTDAVGNTSCYTYAAPYQEDTVAVSATSRAITTQNNLTCRSANTTSRSGGIVTPLCTTVGVDEPTDHGTLSLYPNPAQQSCTISGNFNEKVAIYVSNSLGQTVQVFENIQLSDDRPFVLDVSTMANGMYTVQVLSEGQLYTQPLVVAQQ